jgi:hypothetical protein
MWKAVYQFYIIFALILYRGSESKEEDRQRAVVSDSVFQRTLKGETDISHMKTLLS